MKRTRIHTLGRFETETLAKYEEFLFLFEHEHEVLNNDTYCLKRV